MFSVIVPTYNRSQMLDRCLRSVKDQTWQEYEVIILDDCSLDDTSKVVAKYLDDERFNYIRFEKNNGYCFKTIKHAIDSGLVHYERILILGDDDFFADNDFLEKCAEHLSVYPETDLIVANIAIDHGALLLRYEFLPLPQYFYYNEASSDVKEILFKKNFINVWHIEKYKSSPLFTDSVESMEIPWEFTFSDSYIGYVDVVYGVTEFYQKHKKYLDVEKLVYGCCKNICVEFAKLKSLYPEERAYEIIKQTMCDMLLPKETFLATVSNYNPEAIAELLLPFVHQEESFLRALKGIAAWLKENYTDIFVARHQKLYSQVMGPKAIKGVFESAKTFAIYGKGFLYEQILAQWSSAGKRCIYVIDDFVKEEGVISLDEFLALSADSLPDVVILATAKTLLIENMLSRLEPLPKSVCRLTLMVAED